MKSAPSATPYLFVYGTLMRNSGNPFAEQLRNSSEYIGTGSFPGKLYLVSWYPGAVSLPGAASRVYGEIYRMTQPAPLLQALDDYEEVLPDPEKSLYLRRIVPVSTDDGLSFPCWAYIYNRTAEGLQELPDGRFPRPD